jgi:hypothetical protein
MPGEHARHDTFDAQVCRSEDADGTGTALEDETPDVLLRHVWQLFAVDAL